MTNRTELRAAIRPGQYLCLLSGAAIASALAVSPAAAGGDGHHHPVGGHHAPREAVYTVAASPFAAAYREVRVVPRFWPQYSAPAYLAESRAPTVVQVAPWEEWVDGGSVVGPAPVEATTSVVIGTPVVRYRPRHHHHWWW